MRIKKSSLERELNNVSNSKNKTMDVKHIKEEAGKKLHKVEETVSAHLGKAHKCMKDKAEKVDKYVEENPRKSALIGVGVGVALGALIAKVFGGKKNS